MEEYLRLRETRTVHRKWATVQVAGTRFAVTPTLRGRRVQVLYDPSDLAYVLIAVQGHIVERATPQQPGVIPRPPDRPPAPEGPPTDDLALLRADHERRVRTELSALRLHPPPATEVDLPGLIALLESCREVALTDPERSEAAACWRRLRPLALEPVRQGLDSARRRLGAGLHLSVYLQALERHVVTIRATPAPATTAKPKGPTS